MYNSSKLIYLDQNKLSDYAKCLCGHETHRLFCDVVNKINHRTDSGEWIIPVNQIQLLECTKYEDTPGKTGTTKETNDKILCLLNKSKLQLLDYLRVLRQELYDNINGIETTPNRVIIPYDSIPFPFSTMKLSLNDKTSGKEITDEKYIKALNDFLNKYAYNMLYNNDLDKFKKELKGIIEDAESLKKLDEIKQFIEIYRNTLLSAFNNFGMDFLNERKTAYINIKKSKGKRYADKVFTLECFLNFVLDVNNSRNNAREIIIPDYILKNENALYDFAMKNKSFRVFITIVLSLYSNEKQIIQENDIKDIIFLSVAIPYCDIVITEKTWANLVCDKKLDILFDTKVSKDLNILLGE